MLLLVEVPVPLIHFLLIVACLVPQNMLYMARVATLVAKRTASEELILMLGESILLLMYPMKLNNHVPHQQPLPQRIANRSE
jgi:hypothetical protein